MGRLRRTHVRSFSHGLMLAALPVLAFLGVDYLVALPAGQGAVHEPSRPILASGEIVNPSDSWRSSDVTPAGGESELPKRQHNTGQHPTGSLTSRSPNLAVSIQNELRRVGCYAGDADGTWNEGTRAAMRAFNTSVHVNLATDKPDYILLTLLQGHSSKACSRSCDSVSATGAAVCIDKSIEARALPPGTLATKPVHEEIRGEAHTSSVSVPGPILLSKPAPALRPATAVAPAATAPAKRWVSEVDPAPPAPASVEPLITGSTSRDAPDAVSASRPKPLAGRMAVGALPIPEARPGSGSSTDISSVRPVERPRATAPVVSRGSRPERSVPERGSRLSRTFSDLTRSSP
jgi:peptidoglycan hydrolase-like protein with peptidoglycan-binding domain